jgi:hypothetical protein
MKELNKMVESYSWAMKACLMNYCCLKLSTNNIMTNRKGLLNLNCCWTIVSPVVSRWHHCSSVWRCSLLDENYQKFSSYLTFYWFTRIDEKNLVANWH